MRAEDEQRHRDDSSEDQDRHERNPAERRQEPPGEREEDEADRKAERDRSVEKSRFVLVPATDAQEDGSAGRPEADEQNGQENRGRCAHETTRR